MLLKGAKKQAPNARKGSGALLPPPPSAAPPIIPSRKKDRVMMVGKPSPPPSPMVPGKQQTSPIAAARLKIAMQQQQQQQQQPVPSQSDTAGGEEEDVVVEQKLEALARAADGDGVRAFLRWALDDEGCWDDGTRSKVLHALFGKVNTDAGNVLVPLGLGILALSAGVDGVAFNAAKLLFRLSRKEENDQAFIDSQELIPFLVRVVKNVPVTSSTALYGLGALKNIMGASKLGLRCILDGGIVDVVETYLDTGAIELLSGQSENVDDARGDQILVQVFAILRALLNVSSAQAQILDSPSSPLAASVSALGSFHAHPEVALNISRALSKASLLPDACRVLATAPVSFGPVVLSVLGSQEHHYALAVRLLFALGNVTLDHMDVCRSMGSRKTVNELFRLITAWSDVYLGATQSQDESTRIEVQDVLVKGVRLLANLCVDHKVGERVATHSGMGSILTLLESLDVESSEELVLNVVALVTNVSFFVETAKPNVVLEEPTRLVQLLLPLLVTPNWEMVHEVARAYGNLSRYPEARALMARLRADEAMVVLLAWDSDDVLFAVAGVLTNLLADEPAKAALQRYGGVDALIGIIGAATAAAPVIDVVCKALYNFAYRNASAPLTTVQAAALSLALSSLLDQVEALGEGSAPCFALVAYKLLELVDP